MPDGNISVSPCLHWQNLGQPKLSSTDLGLMPAWLPVTGVTASKSEDLEFQASSIAAIKNISSSVF